VGPSDDRLWQIKPTQLAVRCTTGFVQTPVESSEIKMLRFSGLESLVKRHRSWKTVEEFWNFKVVVLKILLLGLSIAH